MGAKTVTASDPIDALANELKELKKNYELYFQGIERIEPAREREKFKKRLRELLSQNDRNTGRKFRLQGLQASLVTYENHWNRICTQIEEGTYKRHLQRIASAKSEDAPAPSQSPADPMQKLYEDYVSIQTQLGKKADLSKDALEKTVQKQIAAVKQKHACQEVDVQLTMQNGKATLRVVPK
jgi:hypothetical protein